MPDCRAACQRSEEECAACLAGGLPKLIASAMDMVQLAHEHGLVDQQFAAATASKLAALSLEWEELVPEKSEG